MELFDVRTNPRRLSRPPHSFKSPIKPQAVKFIKTHQTYLPPPNLLSKEDDIKIIQAMRKVRFEYQSIFSFEKIYEDEPNSPKLESQKETHETQHIVCDVERKGFQFYQYSANNPVEDAMCSYQIPELNAFVVSIFDGHGGWDLARFCAKNAPKYFQNFIKNGLKLHKYENNKIQLIKDGLSQLHYQLQNEYYKLYLKKIGQQNRKIKSVGTCAITIVMYQKKCIVANCGDSQAMSISQDRGSYNYQKLSQRYSVANRSQRLRLLQQFRQVDQNIIVEQRKNTFYLKGMLQPTRSIGDYYLKHKQHYLGDDEFKGPYLSCQPDIKVYDLKEHDRYVVVASDGLWDYLSKWEILKYVIEARNDKVTIAQRETQSEAQDQIQSKPIVSSKYLIQKILQKVSNDFDIDIEYIKSLQLGERRSYHDDVTIAIIDIQEFFHNK